MMITAVFRLNRLRRRGRRDSRFAERHGMSVRRSQAHIPMSARVRDRGLYCVHGWAAGPRRELTRAARPAPGKIARGATQLRGFDPGPAAGPGGGQRADAARRVHRGRRRLAPRIVFRGGWCSSPSGFFFWCSSVLSNARRTPEEHQKNTRRNARRTPEEPRRTQKEKNTSPPV